MATGQPSEAVKVLAQLKSNERLAGFVAYNLGIALLQDGRPQKRSSNWTRRQLSADDPPVSRSATSRTWCWHHVVRIWQF